MQEAIEKAAVLIEALPYIQSFHEQVFVIKLGGSAMKDEPSLLSTLTDIVFLNQVGIHPVVVNGGGAAITEAMARSGLTPRFVAGHRFTDEKTLAIVEEVLVNQVNADIVRKIIALGSWAEGLHRKNGNVLLAEKYWLEDPSGNRVDPGFVGKVVRVDAPYIQRVALSGHIPVIAPIASGVDAHAYNCNADNAACKVAEALSAQKLVFLSDVPGILTKEGDPSSRVSSAARQEIERLIASRTIQGGMLPKVKEALEGISRGVKKVHIIDGRLPHSLLLEIFTKEGIGTEITGA